MTNHVSIVWWYVVQNGKQMHMWSVIHPEIQTQVHTESMTTPSTLSRSDMPANVNIIPYMLVLQKNKLSYCQLHLENILNYRELEWSFSLSEIQFINKTLQWEGEKWRQKGVERGRERQQKKHREGKRQTLKDRGRRERERFTTKNINHCMTKSRLYDCKGLAHLLIISIYFF